MVELVFCPPTAKAILQIPLSMVARDDEMFWPLTIDYIIQNMVMASLDSKKWRAQPLLQVCIMF